MNTERKPLDFGGLDDFDAPSSPPSSPHEARKAVDRTSAFPSRERAEEAQFNIRASAEAIRRFRAMAKADRYTLGGFLEVLLDAYDKNTK